MLSEAAHTLDSTRIFSLSQRDFTQLSAFIYEKCGIKMPPVKKTMLEARLQKRLRTIGCHSFTEYCEYLMSPRGIEQELVKMIDLVTTNKTDFFREPDHFTYLTGKILPAWLTEMGRGSPRKLSIWSAGCSTGEEPYTLAMLLSEFAESNPGFSFQIMATDISTRVLEKARTAVYDVERVEPVPMPLKKKYLLRSRDRNSGLVRVVPALREKIRFGRLNFMDDDFGLREPFDIIFCRNVVIYFDRQTQERLLNKFYRCMRPGAYIFMGHSETLNGLAVPLVQAHPTIYRREL